MNKKAQLGEQLMFFSFFFFLILIAVGISTGVYIFFSADYETNLAESQILNSKISECLASNDFTFQEYATTPPEEFYSKCNLNQKVIEDNFVLSISLEEKEVYRLNSPEKCNLEVYEEAPKCSSTSISTDKGTFKVTTGTAQKIKRETG